MKRAENSDCFPGPLLDANNMGSSTAVVLALFCVFAVATLSTFYFIGSKEQDAYMDEIFHVPQARNYCAGNFSHWDPMITTLPGLYLVSIGLYKPVTSVLSLPQLNMCTVQWLRATNVLFCLANFYLIYSILKKLHNPLMDQDGMLIAMTTLALSCLPVLYFFTFLYYTDPGSTFFVLLMYLYSLHSRNTMGAAFGILAILFRQTNIIWVVFVAGLAIRKELSLWIREESSKKDIKLEDMSDLKLLQYTCVTLFTSIRSRRSDTVDLMRSFLKQTWAYIVVGLGFGIFIVLNQGIVVGDRSHHTACLNFPQIFYFLSFTNFFSIFHLCSPYKIWDFLKFVSKHPLTLVCFAVISGLLIHYFTYEHKYLLADNRHYTFYIWSKIYRRSMYVKYALISIYYYFAWSVCSELTQRDVFWKLMFFICLLASLVPQKLLELRYFILPYLIFRINMRYGTRVGLLHEILLALVINIATIYMFTQKTFKWSGHSGVQRFMW